MSTTFVIGAGPTGLAVTALLQRVTDRNLVLFEKRPAYTRNRMVTLSPLLLAHDLADYERDNSDGDDLRAVFKPDDLAELLDSKRSMPEDFISLLRELGTDFVPLNEIEACLARLVEEGRPIDRRHENVTIELLEAIAEPGDTVLDCTGRNSLTRDALHGGDNTMEFILEYALVAAFTFDNGHLCDDTCKNSGSIGNDTYDFIPSVRRSYSIDGQNTVVGIVEISPEDFARLPRTLDQEWLTSSGDPVTSGIKCFLDAHMTNSHEDQLSNLTITTLPLNLYCAHRFTHVRADHLVDSDGIATFLLGDAAIGSPYFQSISLGLECAIFLAWLLSGTQPDDAAALRRYEQFMERQWIRVYMSSKAIKYNKDVLSAVDDIPRLLEYLHIY